MDDKKSLWSEAGLAGLALGAVSLAYMTYSFLASGDGSTQPNGFQSVFGTILWAVKLFVCLWLLKRFMKAYSTNNPDAGNSDVFRFGMATAALSALIYSGGYLAWTTLVNPDYFSNIVETFIDSADSMGSLVTEDMLDNLEAMVPQFPTTTFFVNLAWCFMFCTVFSAIFSRNIPSSNPFDGLDEQ